MLDVNLFNNLSPIKIVERDGSQYNPYEDIRETITLASNRVFTKEVPAKQYKVQVYDEVAKVTYREAKSPSGLKVNEFYVDYNYGIVTFNPIVIKKNLQFTYKGTGMILISSDRIIINSENGDVQETLEGLIARSKADLDAIRATLQQMNQQLIDTEKVKNDTLQVKIDTLKVKDDTLQIQSDLLVSKQNADTATANANTATNNANTKATLADTKATLADQKATLAQQKADLANTAATNANDKATVAQQKIDIINQKIIDSTTATQNAITAKEHAEMATSISEQATDNANTATINANTQATYAKTQGDYAKTQGDYAKSKGDIISPLIIQTQQLITDTTKVKTDTLSAKTAAESATQEAINRTNQFQQAINDSMKIYKGLVENFVDLQTLFPTPQFGWTVYVKNDATEYRWDGTKWLAVSYTSASNFMIPNGEYWTATEGQTVFNLTSGKYITGKKLLNVIVGGVPQVSGLNFTETSQTSFTLSVGVTAGTVVVANWFEGQSTLTTGHSQTHRKGAQDELAIQDLAGYEEIAQIKADILTKETPSGAQTKANTAESNAKSYTDTKISGLINNAPEALDTLKELSDALGNDANFATTVTNQLATKETPTGAQAKVDTHANDTSKHLTPTEKTNLHSHTNKLVLEGLSDNAGMLQYKGVDIGGNTADKISVTDTADYYAGTNVETILAEIGQGVLGVRTSMATSINGALNA